MATPSSVTWLTLPIEIRQQIVTQALHDMLPSDQAIDELNLGSIQFSATVRRLLLVNKGHACDLRQPLEVTKTTILALTKPSQEELRRLKAEREAWSEDDKEDVDLNKEFRRMRIDRPEIRIIMLEKMDAAVEKALKWIDRLGGAYVEMGTTVVPPRGKHRRGGRKNNEVNRSTTNQVKLYMMARKAVPILDNYEDLD